MMTRFWLWLARFAAARLASEAILVPEEMKEALRVARALVADISRSTGVSGEWKRHQVYAAMIKVFDKPLREKKIRQRHLGLAVELAVNAPTDR